MCCRAGAARLALPAAGARPRSCSCQSVSTLLHMWGCSGAGHLLHLPVLPWPKDVVQELAVVKPVVVRRVVLRMVRRREHSCLVPVDRVVREEVLDLGKHRRWRLGAAPQPKAPREHRNRPAAVHLSQPAKDGQLVVRHAHVGLVRLRRRARAQWLQLRRRRRALHACKLRIAQMLRAPPQEAPQVLLADAPNGVDVCAAAVVLGHVATQALVNIGAAEHQQEARAAARPRRQLRQQERDDHADARLDVLQRQVLRGRAAINAEARRLAGNALEQRHKGVTHGVNL
mmetsp:Transcript_27668/g.81901  ORF Transcript_27668/g.81901 Transcript_27668/m.81901 type:complete len:286 (+) Transcript_27668:455-1312(+)